MQMTQQELSQEWWNRHAIQTLFQAHYHHLQQHLVQESWAVAKEWWENLSLGQIHVFAPPTSVACGPSLVSPPDTTILQQDMIRHWDGSSHHGSWQPLLSWPKVILLNRAAWPGSTFCCNYLFSTLSARFGFNKLGAHSETFDNSCLCWMLRTGTELNKTSNLCNSTMLLSFCGLNWSHMLSCLSTFELHVCDWRSNSQWIPMNDLG